MKRNLVLGGSGTIGSALCKELKAHGEEVINLDIKIGYDLRSLNLFNFKEVDYVWFLAWEVGGAKFLYNADNQLQIIQNNTQICQNVFSFLKSTQIPFLFASSQLASYDNAYGVTKKLGEQWSHIINGSIVRFWNVYGWETPGEKAHIIPDLVVKALQKQPIKLMTNGEEERQFIFMHDTVKNLIKMREMGLKEADMTNNQWIKIKDLAQIITTKLGTPLELGSEKGYCVKIEANDTSKLFAFDTTLEVGVDNIIKLAKDYLKKS
ncbi:MAG: NAD(P)-dependent oxidoreductase [Salinivirgaceae bacterium]